MTNESIEVSFTSNRIPTLLGNKADDRRSVLIDLKQVLSTRKGVSHCGLGELPDTLVETKGDEAIDDTGLDSGETHGLKEAFVVGIATIHSGNVAG